MRHLNANMGHLKANLICHEADQAVSPKDEDDMLCHFKPKSSEISAHKFRSGLNNKRI